MNKEQFTRAGLEPATDGLTCQGSTNCRISSARKIIPLDHNPSATTTTPMKIGLWNAQSMMNKPTEVCDFVLTEKLDILAITEAWLRGDSRDGPALADIQSTLRDYHLLKMFWSIIAAL